MKKESIEMRAAGGTEGGRSPSGVPPAGEPAPVGRRGRVPADPEVRARAVRRQYPAAYKAQIVAEAAACTAPGEIGALLRREGLYSSLLATWRRQQEAGALAGLTPQPRGRKPKQRPVEKENEQLRREVQRLREQLRQAELIIGVQKKSPRFWGFRWTAQGAPRATDGSSRDLGT